MAQSTRVPWYRKKRWWALIAAPFVLFVLVFYVFDPVVEAASRKLFSRVKGYTLTFEDASLKPVGLHYELTKFKVVKEGAGGEKRPMLYVREMHISVLWRELLHGNVVASVWVDTPKINVIAAKSKKAQQAEADFPDLAKQLNELAPIRVDRVEVRNGELTFTDRTAEESPQVWLHGMEATIENLSTRAALARGEPTVLAMSSKLQKKGELSAYITADPLAKGLWFSGQVKAVGLDVREFHDLIASKTGVALSAGTLDVLAEFDCRESRLSGGVKPILKNPQVVQAKPGVENWFKKALADVSLEIFSDRTEPGQKRVATRIPIEGRLDNPDLQLWPTILGVVRNAFVEGISASFDDLPPPKAPKKEGFIDQAIDALDKKEEAAPKAQPVDDT